MSLDFYLIGIPKTVTPVELYNGNATHNLVPMWDKAGITNILYHSYGKKACEVVDILDAGYRDMLAKPDEYKLLNPSNGWGDYDCALEFLRNTIEACKENPDATIEVSA